MEDSTLSRPAAAGPAPQGAGALHSTQPRWTLVLAVALSAVLLAASIWLRAPKAEYIYVNQDAPWHVLHTMYCYDGIDASEHLFLPLVTPNHDARGLIWGATAQSDSGIFYYTSFWPLAFVLAWGFANLLGLPYTLPTLYALNSVLLVVCVALACLFFLRVLGGRLPATFTIVCTTALFAFQPEVLQSLGTVYWHQSLTQVVLLGQLLALAHFGTKPGKIAFFALCFAAPLCEWSGLVANVGFAAYLFFFGVPGDEARRSWPARFGLAAGVGGASLAALGLTLLHYTRRLSLDALISAWTLSYSVRGDADWDPFLQYVVMLFRSHRPLWTLVVLLAVVVLVVPAARKRLLGLLKPCWPWVALAAFPVLENLALRQHAVEYTYDRMKAATPLLLVFLLLCACLLPALGPLRWRRVLAGGLAAITLGCAVHSLWGYLAAPNYYVLVDERDYLGYNRVLSEKILALYPRADSFYGMGLQVRGYTNILWQGGLMEMVDLDATLAEGTARGKRYIIYLDARGGQSSTYRFLTATVVDTHTGQRVVHDPWNEYDFDSYQPPE